MPNANMIPEDTTEATPTWVHLPNLHTHEIDVTKATDRAGKSCAMEGQGCLPKLRTPNIC